MTSEAVKSDADRVAGVAEAYYDSEDADNFYFHIWGGEDIHVGLYRSADEPVRDASRRTVERMAETLQDLGPETEVLDIGAGYGGAARYLAKTYGCKVVCLNISEAENARNRQYNEEQGVADKIRVVHGSFEDIPEGDAAFDVVWSQDAILHSGNREKVLAEVARVLKPGGQFVFTDPMQADDVPNQDVLKPILERIHLDTLGSAAFYRAELKKRGFEEIGFEAMPEQLRAHYDRVRRALLENYEDMKGKCSTEYMDRMIAGLKNWVEGADSGYLNWGILHFRKK